MKRILIILLFPILLPGSLLARDFNNDVLVSANLGGGLTWPGGSFNRNYETEAAWDWSYSGGLAAAWAPFSFGAVSFGAEYSCRRLSVDMTDTNGLDITETMAMQFIDLTLGWKGFASNLYYEGGFFVGFPFGDWENTATRGGSKSVPVLGPNGSVESGNRHREYGAYLGLGGMYWIRENIALEAGVRLQVSFTEGYENSGNPDQNTLKTRALAARVGVTYCL